VTASGSARVWLITGAGRGLGRAFTDAAIRGGDQVIATVRSEQAHQEMRDAYPASVLPVLADVTDRAAVLAAAAQGHTHFGRIDVLVNNAGYGLAGGVEEISEEQARRQMDVNFFGALWCTQAVLPVMRAQGSGHIFQISSLGGVAAFPNTGLYNASKWALEGMSESLAREAAWTAPSPLRNTARFSGPAGRLCPGHTRSPSPATPRRRPAPCA
jgi:NAD(P)-dependent dehydrogenase (short-subunit alcohol dehydrogenase family)